MKNDIIHDLEKKQFYLLKNGLKASASYQIIDGQVNAYSTFVPKELAGRGIASLLVAELYKYAAKNDLKVVPACSYIDTWVKRHPEYLPMTILEK